MTEQAKALLPDNQSIVLSITRYASPYIYNSIHPISNYLIKGDDTVNENILKLYDENISSITVKDNNVRIVLKMARTTSMIILLMHLKFYHQVLLKECIY